MKVNRPSIRSQEKYKRSRSLYPYFNPLGLLVSVSVLAMILAQAQSQGLEAILYLGRWVPLGLLTVYAVTQWALRPRWSGPAIRQATGVDAWMLSWIGLAYCSFIYSVAPEITVVMATTFLLGYGAVFWGVWHYADRFGEDAVVNILFWLATGVIVASWVGLLTGYGSPLRESVVLQETGVLTTGRRFQGVLENPNSLGLLSALVIPLTLDRALRRGGSFYILFLLGLTIATLLYTGSRSSIGATCVGSLYILWKSESVSNRTVFIYLIGIIGFVLYSLRGQIETTILREGSLSTASQRTVMWGIFFDYIWNQPLLGHGWGTEDLLHGFYGTNTEKYFLRQDLAASSYVGFAAQVGFIGMAAFFLPLFWLGGHTALVSRGGHLRPHILNAVLLIGLTTAAVESWMSSLGNAQSLLFWIPVMLLVRRRVRARTRRREQVAASGAPPATSRR